MDSDAPAQNSDARGLELQDGLCRVETQNLCAGFVIEGGKVVACAPILRRRLAYWMGIAQFVPSRRTP